jgi:hypothetical protein
MRDGMTGSRKGRHHVHNVTIRIVAAAIVLGTASGCTAEDASPAPAVSQSPAPGTVSVHLNGRVEADFGTSTR